MIAMGGCVVRIGEKAMAGHPLHGGEDARVTDAAASELALHHALAFGFVVAHILGSGLRRQLGAASGGLQHGDDVR